MSNSRPPRQSLAPPGDEKQLCDYLEGERTLLELRCCEPKRLSALIHDLSQPMSPSLEQAIARCLAGRELNCFAPALTLLPAMMQRFGLEPDECRHDPAIHGLRTVCSACPKVAGCWLALRQGASLEECQAFCPNAESLEHLVGRLQRRDLINGGL